MRVNEIKTAVHKTESYYCISQCLYEMIILKLRTDMSQCMLDILLWRNIYGYRELCVHGKRRVIWNAKRYKTCDYNKKCNECVLSVENKKG